MKFVLGKIKGGEYEVGQDVSLTNVEHVDIPANHPMAPHDYSPTFSTAGLYPIDNLMCSICGQPESARRHHFMEE